MSKLCEECENCIPIGGGDHICDLENKVVVEDYASTNDYMYCCGKDFIER